MKPQTNKALRQEIDACCQMFPFIVVIRNSSYMGAAEYLRLIMSNHKQGKPLVVSAGREPQVTHGVSWYIPRNYTDKGWANSLQGRLQMDGTKRRIYIGIDDDSAGSFRQALAEIISLKDPAEWSYYVLQLWRET